MGAGRRHHLHPAAGDAAEGRASAQPQRPAGGRPHQATDHVDHAGDHDQGQPTTGRWVSAGL